MNFTRAKSSCEPRSKLKQTKLPSAPLNKVSMRSFFDEPDSDDPVSFEFCNVNTRTSSICKNINNGGIANAFIEFSDSCQTSPQNGSVTILPHKTNVATSKSRVPDILMINKYYGLIPQKFAISSRKLPGSTPSSAHGSRGATKSSSSKPRAKSSTHHHRHQDGKSFEKLKGCRSDNDSPEPIKMVVIARKGSLDHPNSTLEERSSDPFGPVTKKMSVEKYKKWKHGGGGGKGRNVNVRSCSVGETLSLMDKELPDVLDGHANRSSPEYLANRRVIKIDLNKVSWDEENYQITTSITDSTMPNFVGEDETAKQMPNGTHETKPTWLCTKDNNESSFNAESERITIANNDNVYRPLRTKAELVDNSSLVTSKDFVPEKKNMQSTATSKKSCGESTYESSEPKNDYIPQRSHNHNIRSKSNFTPNDKSKDGLVMDEINGNCEKAYDVKKTVSTHRGKLGRTISFDEKILDGCGGSASESLSSGRSDSSKKRPMTASTQYVNKTTTFQTPNNFNPPSKVIPWTQQSTAGGKPLTLAERRAKFQRATSIHSSSSLSLEGGDEETSEVDSSNCIKLPTNSSAYRETRKPLHVIQAPEVPTLISQINPNADEDIQIEIEKVAIMLKKMQTKNFSVSLDSGIEAEMVKTSSEPNSISLNHAQNSSLLKLSESVLMAGTHSTLKRSESESSVASDDSNSFEEPSQMKTKTNSSSTATKVRGRVTSDKFVDKSKELLSISGLRARQCSANNSANNSISPANKRTSSINSSSAAATNTTARRPPLRKAVSISCEQELLKTGAQRRNEVNSSVNDNGKSPRPKTAAGSHQLQRSYGTGTNRSTHNYNHRLTSNVSPFDNRASTANGSSSSSQGSKNRKILIKKALMEINQSSVNLRRKWGTLGRPRTAPNLEKNAVHHDTVSQQHPSNPQLRQKPLKASPLPISGNGKIVAASSGKSSSVGGKSNSEAMEGGKSEQSSPTGQPRANSEAPEENDSSQQQQQRGGSSKQAMFRQCFSLDETALLGFSIKSVNEGRIPLFEKWADMASGESSSTSILDDELSFLSAKKREQCLKVYEKMKKTGCAVKLDTIFRGMLTPSEYRAFMRAAENAAQAADEAEKAKNESEDQEAGENTGISKQDAHTVDI